MKRYLYLLLNIVLLCSQAKADVNWSIYITQDNAKTIEQIIISTDTTRLNLVGASVKCVVSPVQVSKTPDGQAFEVRWLTCEFIEGSATGIMAACLQNSHSNGGENVLYLRNLGKVYQLMLGCLDIPETK